MKTIEKFKKDLMKSDMNILRISLISFFVVTVLFVTTLRFHSLQYSAILLLVMLLMSTVLTPTFFQKVVRSMELKKLSKEYLDFFDEVKSTEGLLDREEFLRLKRYLYNDSIAMHDIFVMYLYLTHSVLRGYKDEPLVNVFMKNVSRKDLADILTEKPKKILMHYSYLYIKRKYLSLVEDVDLLQEFDILTLNNIQEEAERDYKMIGTRPFIALYNRARRILEKKKIT